MCLPDRARAASASDASVGGGSVTGPLRTSGSAVSRIGGGLAAGGALIAGSTGGTGATSASSGSGSSGLDALMTRPAAKPAAAPTAAAAFGFSRAKFCAAATSFSASACCRNSAAPWTRSCRLLGDVRGPVLALAPQLVGDHVELVGSGADLLAELRGASRRPGRWPCPSGRRPWPAPAPWPARRPRRPSPWRRPRLPGPGPWRRAAASCAFSLAESPPSLGLHLGDRRRQATVVEVLDWHRTSYRSSETR